MAENDAIVKSRWERLDQYYKLSLAIIILMFAKDEVINAYHALFIRGHNWETTLLSSVLLFLVVILVLLWMKVVSDEMLLLKNNLYDYILKLPSSSFSAAIGLSLFLGVLAYFSDDIVKFSLVFAIFKLFEIWSLWLRDSLIGPGVYKAKGEISEAKKLSNIIALENYYLKRPHIPLAATILVISFVSAILGLINTSSNYYINIAYIIIIFAIIINEIVFAFWRYKRDMILEADT